MGVFRTTNPTNQKTNISQIHSYLAVAHRVKDGVLLFLSYAPEPSNQIALLTS